MLPQAMSQNDLNKVCNLVKGLCDPAFLSNRADGKDVVISAEDRESLLRLVEEVWNERQARSEVYELLGVRASEILALRSRVKQLEDAIRVSIDFDTGGHAWWDGEGEAKIGAGGHKLLKETLEKA